MKTTLKELSKEDKAILDIIKAISIYYGIPSFSDKAIIDFPGVREGFRPMLVGSKVILEFLNEYRKGMN